MGIGQPLLTADVSGLPLAALIGIFVVVLAIAVVAAAALARQTGQRHLSQRLSALGTRLGLDPPEDENNIESALAYLEQVTGAANEAVASSSADAIRLRRSLDNLPQGMVLCDENGTVVYRNARATALMTSRHGDALAAQAVTELLEDAWHEGSAEHTLDLYGPPRRTLTVRAVLIDDGRRPLGVMAMIEDVSERRRLEEIRRDFVANVSHELKTPMGALGLLAETLVSEPDIEVSKRLAARIHTEAFRVSRIIDDLLDLSRIESEEAPPREPVPVDLVMAEAAERVRSAADQRGITLVLEEPDPPVAVFGDRRQLVSAMHALLENAVTYSYDHSSVTVSGRVVRGATGAASVPGVEAAASASAPSLPGAGIQPLVTTPAATAQGGATADVPAAGLSDVDTVPGRGGPIPVGGQGVGADGLSAAAGSDTGGGVDRPMAQTTAPPAASSPPAASVTAIGGSPVSSAGIDPETGTPGTPATPSASSSDTPDGHDGDQVMVHLSVSDHGIGIPARDLDRIFERFYRVDHGRSRDTGGTGLGLSIVRHVANNHQGWVDVESREGEGSTFTLVLPLADGPRPFVGRSRL
jgi:two-component system sensor histidine kinase SenX3